MQGGLGPYISQINQYVFGYLTWSNSKSLCLWVWMCSLLWLRCSAQMLGFRLSCSLHFALGGCVGMLQCDDDVRVMLDLPLAAPGSWRVLILWFRLWLPKLDIASQACNWIKSTTQQEEYQTFFFFFFCTRDKLPTLQGKKTHYTFWQNTKTYLFKWAQKNAVFFFFINLLCHASKCNLESIKREGNAHMEINLLCSF